MEVRETDENILVELDSICTEFSDRFNQNFIEQLKSNTVRILTLKNIENDTGFNNGEYFADTLVLRYEPTEQESIIGVPFINATGVFIRTLLELMNYRTRYSYVCFDSIKEEIEVLIPKKIFVDGPETLKKLSDLFDLGLPENAQYGTIFNVDMCSTKIQIMYLGDTEELLKLDGDSFKEEANKYWQYFKKGVEA